VVRRCAAVVLLDLLFLVFGEERTMVGPRWVVVDGATRVDWVAFLGVVERDEPVLRLVAVDGLTLLVLGLRL
jgi:hypothetical protein